MSDMFERKKQCLSDAECKEGDRSPDEGPADRSAGSGVRPSRRQDIGLLTLEVTLEIPFSGQARRSSGTRIAGRSLGDR